MLELTPFRRTVLVMVLVAIPWFLVGVFSFAFFMQAHLQEELQYSFGMKLSILVGALMCLSALALCADGVRKQEGNLLLYVFALTALWFLLEWPAKAMLSLLRA